MVDLGEMRIPTNLPEMAAQRRVSPPDVSVEPPDMQVDEPTNAPTQTAEDMNVDTRVKLKATRNILPSPIWVCIIFKSSTTTTTTTTTRTTNATTATTTTTYTR